jgi:lipopolysaccharide/colanic/teichoic acid biosynthesis glycosyltransferase
MRPEERKFWRELGIPKQPKHVRPGIFGLPEVDVDDVPNETPGSDRTFYAEVLTGIVRHDREYLQNWSLWMDVKILLKILRHVFRPGQARTQSSQKKRVRITIRP